MSRRIFIKLFICFIAGYLIIGLYGMAARADNTNRVSSWHETSQNDTWGENWTIVSFGPDGDTNYFYDPTSERYISYLSPGIAGDPLMVYKSMYSPLAGAYAGGGKQQVQSIPGNNAQGYLSGNLWGLPTQAQPSLMAHLMSGQMGYGGSISSYGSNLGTGYGAPSYSYPAPYPYSSASDYRPSISGNYAYVIQGSGPMSQYGAQTFGFPSFGATTFGMPSFSAMGFVPAITPAVGVDLFSNWGHNIQPRTADLHYIRARESGLLVSE